MFNVGPEKLMVVLFIALIVLGPDKLPNAARQIGRYLNEFRRISQGFQQELRSAMDVTDLGSAAASPVNSSPVDSGPLDSDPVDSSPAVADAPAAAEGVPTTSAASTGPGSPAVAPPADGAPETTAPVAGSAPTDLAVPSDSAVATGANIPQVAGAAPPTIPSVSGQLDSNRAPQA